MMFAKMCFGLVQEMVGSWLNKEMVGSDRLSSPGSISFFFKLFLLFLFLTTSLWNNPYWQPWKTIGFYFQTNCSFYILFLCWRPSRPKGRVHRQGWKQGSDIAANFSSLQLRLLPTFAASRTLCCTALCDTGTSYLELPWLAEKF